MRKGITPVIAIVLLLLITISMVGFASVWFGDMLEQVGENTEEKTMSDIKKRGQTIKIDMADESSGIYVRNTGNYEINMSDISVYTEAGQEKCGTSGTLTPGEVVSCSAGCSEDETVRVTGPSNEDSRTCR